MEAICHPLAEMGCEDILPVTQAMVLGRGGLEFFPLSHRISGLAGMGWTERAARPDRTSLAKPTEAKG